MQSVPSEGRGRHDSAPSSVPSSGEYGRHPRGAGSAASSSTRRATLLRFAASGLSASVSYALIFLTLAEGINVGDQVSNLVATVVSTVLVSELHRRFTFRGERRASWTQWQGVGGGMAVAGLAASSLALAYWNWIAPDANGVASVLVVYAVNALVGLANFFTLGSLLVPANRDDLAMSTS